MHLTSDLSPSLTDVTSKISVESIYSFLSSLWVQAPVISGLNDYRASSQVWMPSLLFSKLNSNQSDTLKVQTICRSSAQNSSKASTCFYNTIGTSSPSFCHWWSTKLRWPFSCSSNITSPFQLSNSCTCCTFCLKCSFHGSFLFSRVQLKRYRGCHYQK